MAQYSRATLTDAGVVIARRMMDDDSLHLTFTGIASGDGQYSAGESLAAKTALKSQKQFFPLSSKKTTSDQVVQLKYIISNVNPDGTPLTVGYYVREVGVYAQINSEAAVLYAIAIADENTADYLPEYNELQPSTITMDWFLTVANTLNISIADSAGAYALAADLADTNALVATKITAQGGDASGALISSVTPSDVEYPAPAAGDSISIFAGKVIKFFTDIVNVFTGATSLAPGKKGLVPAPSAGQQTAYMRGDGSWAQPQNNATTTQAGYVLDAQMGKTLHDEITTLGESLERTGDTNAVKFNTNATGDGMSLRYVIPGGDMYVFRMFGTVGGNHLDFVKMDSGGNIMQTFFSSSRKKVTSICGGGVLTYTDRVCILDYQSANFNANGTAIPAELRPDVLTFACASIAGDTTPYRIGVRTDGTVVFQDYNSVAKTTASNVRGQVMWILSNT